MKLCTPASRSMSHLLRSSSSVSSAALRTQIANQNKLATYLPTPIINTTDLTDQEATVLRLHQRKSTLSPESFKQAVQLYSNHLRQFKQLADLKYQRSQLPKFDPEVAKKDPAEGERVRESSRAMRTHIVDKETELKETYSQLLKISLKIPNSTHPASPIGPESNAVVLETYGPDETPANELLDHLIVGQQLGIIQPHLGAAITGTFWPFISGSAAVLSMALENYATSVAVSEGFQVAIGPDVVREEISSRCGFQPRDDSVNTPTQNYYLQPPNSAVIAEKEETSQTTLVLAATAEITLAGSFINQSIPQQNLPVRLVGVGTAYRSEAGARNHTNRGMYRVHQFKKVEMFSVVEAEKSEDEMEKIRGVQKKIFEGLGLRVRVLDMPTEELGASAYRKYDMEAWMPGRGEWGEISSLSNCTDYQSRRLAITLDKPNGSLLHTLNGTASAIPRLIVAVMENGTVLDENGHIKTMRLPSVLKRFWLGDLEKFGEFSFKLGSHRVIQVVNIEWI